MKADKVWNKLFPSCNAVDFDLTVCKNRKRPPNGIDCLTTCCGICPAGESCKVACTAKDFIDYKTCPHFIGKEKINDPDWKAKATKGLLEL